MTPKTTKTHPDKQPLAGRVAVVTGASRGIGKEAAIALAGAGAHCVLIARTTAGLEETDDAIKALGGSATLVPMDLADRNGIDRLAAGLLDRYGKLDILIGNAALLGVLGPLKDADPNLWDQVLETNLTANWRLIRALTPLLLQSDAPRAVMMSSAVSLHPRAYWGIYSVSKAALNNMALIWADEVCNTPLKVNILSPGGTRTAMRAKAYPGEDPMSLKTPDVIAEKILLLVLPSSTRHGEHIELT